MDTEEYQFQKFSRDVSNRLEVVGQLTSGIAHEINTPVQFVTSNLHYVTGQFDQLIELINRFQNLEKLIHKDNALWKPFQQIREYSKQIDLDFIRQEVPDALSQSVLGMGSIAAIVSSIGSLVNAGNRERVPTNVNYSIRNALSISRGRWKHCCEVSTDLADGLPEVLCYDGELVQVLINLIVNATDAIIETSNYGKIVIRSFVYRQSVGILVEDTGAGIPIEIQHRIFDPFFTTKDVGKGTGQGLAFVHSSIVERNGGTLFFETAQGEGSTFHVYLPFHNSYN